MWVRLWILPRLDVPCLLGRAHHRRLGIAETRFLDGSLVHCSSAKYFEIPTEIGDDLFKKTDYSWLLKRSQDKDKPETPLAASEKATPMRKRKFRRRNRDTGSTRVALTVLEPDRSAAFQMALPDCDSVMALSWPSPNVLSVTEFGSDGRRHLITHVCEVQAPLTFEGQLAALKFGSVCTETDKEKVRGMLRKFREVCADSSFDLGKIKNLPEKRGFFELKLVPGARLPKSRPYRHNRAARAEIARQCEELLRAGLIQRSHSPYASPCLLATKPDGSWRFCIDYRTLNKSTVPDRFPMPLISTLIEQCKGASVFIALDLKSAYWHIIIPEELRPLLAFTTESGLYEWLRMPFGPRNAPATWQRVILDCLKGVEGVYVYLDDILICGKDKTHATKIFLEVLRKLKQHGLKIGVKKCQFFYDEIKFLGYMVSGKGARPCADYVSKVLQVKRPTNKKEIAQFMGLVQYVAQWIPN